VKGKNFENTFIKPVIAALAERVSGLKISRSDPVQPLPKKDPVDHASETLTQSWMWDHLAKFLQPNDVVIAETGTTSFGILYSKIPANIRFVTQTYYGSIGYATAAALGTELALQELHKETGAPRGRTVLITGDGSLQLTMQEIGTMITAGVKPIIVILNNDGYTIERVIHGARQKYNDINKAIYEHMLPFFGHPDPANSYRRVVRKDEWAKVFEDPSLKEPKNIQVIELMLDKFDVPWRLTKLIASRGPKAVKELEDSGFIGEGRVGIGG
jgi:pyruvate decarboxylase